MALQVLLLCLLVVHGAHSLLKETATETEEVELTGALRDDSNEHQNTLTQVCCTFRTIFLSKPFKIFNVQ